jgi:hypothetical protein
MAKPKATGTGKPGKLMPKGHGNPPVATGAGVFAIKGPVVRRISSRSK